MVGEQTLKCPLEPKPEVLDRIGLRCLTKLLNDSRVGDGYPLSAIRTWRALDDLRPLRQTFFWEAGTMSTTAGDRRISDQNEAVFSGVIAGFAPEFTS